MLGPVTLLGTAGAVANIIDTLGKTIITIYDVHQQWKDADLILLNLISQLTALKAALAKIEEWMSTTIDDQHHQLIMDLDRVIACISMLVHRVDGQVGEVQSTSTGDGALTSMGKTKLLLGLNKMEELQSMIQNQTNALTLLLTACNCKTISEQSTVVGKRSTRKAILRIEKDTASLMEIRDDQSFLSRYSDSLSKLSMAFAFDQELFITNVYGRVFRSSMRQAFRKQPRSKVYPVSTIGSPPHNVMYEPAPREQSSEGIDVAPAKVRTIFRYDVKILLLGLPDSGKEPLFEQLTSAHWDKNVDFMQSTAMWEYFPTAKIRQATTQWKRRRLRVFDFIPYQNSEPEEWIQPLPDITSIIYVVDLASYDQSIVRTDGSELNKIMASVEFFDSAVNSIHFEQTPVILLLVNATEFRAKIAYSPLYNYIDEAAHYIRRKFDRVDRRQDVNSYVHLIEPAEPDESTLDIIMDDVDKIMRRKGIE